MQKNNFHHFAKEELPGFNHIFSLMAINENPFGHRQDFKSEVMQPLAQSFDANLSWETWL